MCLRSAREIKVVLMQIVMLILFTGCWEKPRALSIDEALDSDISVPIRCVDPDSSHKDLEVVYYYSGNSSEALLTTYFLTENSNKQMVRVAVMLTCRYCGQLIDANETRGEAPLPVSWAQGDTGACRAQPPTHQDDLYAGNPFQSCLYWFDRDGNVYKLYSVWPEEESVDFANSLVVVEK